VDSLVLWLVKIIDAQNDFVHRDGGCYLNDSGRSKYLKAFLQRMEEEIQQILERNKMGHTDATSQGI